MSKIRNLSAIFLDVFDKDKISKLRLNSEEIEYIRYLLSDNPEVFYKMEAAMNEIMADGRLDIHDLPQIVILVSTIIHINFISVSKKVNIFRVIEYLIDTMIESGILPIPHAEIEFVENIVHSSMTLLRMNLKPTADAKMTCCWG